MKQTMNFYVAVAPAPKVESPFQGVATVMYSGYAPSEERFVELCEKAGFELDGLEIELYDVNPKDEMGRLYKEGVSKDVGTI